MSISMTAAFPFSSRQLIACHTTYRSVIAAVLLPVVPVTHLPSSNHPTPVVIISACPPFPFLIYTSILREGSHNVNRLGGRGIKVTLTGAFFIYLRSALESASAISISDTSLRLTA